MAPTDASIQGVDADKKRDEIIDNHCPFIVAVLAPGGTMLGRTPANRAEVLPSPVDAVIAAIETDVIRGRILPTTRLIEDHLMEDYGAKRHVVRAALIELERLGVVIKPRHRGAEIRRFDAAALEQLYAMRALLHRAAVAAMRLPPDPDRIGVLEAARVAHAQASAAGDLIAIHRSNMTFHRLLYGLCENQYLAESIRLHDWLSFPVRAYGVADARALRIACEEHAAMVEAVRVSDRARLDALSVKHMGNARHIYEAKFIAAELPKPAAAAGVS